MSVIWLPEVEEQRLRSNRARKGDSDYGQPGPVPGKGLPAAKKGKKTSSSGFDESKVKRGKGDVGGQFVGKGDTGAGVSAVQRAVGAPETGTYDAGTAATIIAYQRRHGLQADGIVGEQTALALAGDLAKARRTAPGALSSTTARRFAHAHQPGKRRSKPGRRQVERVGGGLLVHALQEFRESLREDPAWLDEPRDLIGRWVSKAVGGSPGSEHASIPGYDSGKLRFGKRAPGTNGARWARHKDGSQWLVKTYRGDEDRVATELLSNAVYRELGARVPRAGRIRLHDGRQALAYPLLEGKPRKGVFQRARSRPSPEIGRHFMVDALLANWDVAGADDDNILWGSDGLPFRVDQGGTLEMRAMGGPKPFGPVPVEVTTMLQPGGQGRRSSFVTGRDLKRQAQEIAAGLTDGRIEGLVRSARFKDQRMADRVERSLKARVRWMGRFASGQEGLPSPPAKGKGKTAAVAEGVWLPELLEMAAAGFVWKEDLHPRDEFGRFITKIGDLKPGQALQLDAKTIVKHDKKGGFRVVRSGAIHKFETAADAARAAVDKSVKSKDPDSVGGATQHADLNALMKARGAGGVDKPIPGLPGKPQTILFGGESLNSSQASLELTALKARVAAAEASEDKYVKRGLPTLRSREKELAVKLKAAGGDVAGKPKPGTVASYAQIKTDVANIGVGDAQMFENGSVVTHLKMGTVTKWSVKLKGESSAQTYDSSGLAAAAAYKGEHLHAGVLPTHTQITAELESLAVSAEKTYPNGAKVQRLSASKYDVTIPEEGEVKTYDSAIQAAAAIKLATHKGVPTDKKPTGGKGAAAQTVIQGIAKDVQALTLGQSKSANGVTVTRMGAEGLESWKVTTPDGEAKVSTGILQVAATMATGKHVTPMETSKLLKGEVEIKDLAVPAKKMKGKQPVPLDPAWHHKPHKLKDLNIAEGDTIQHKKGGWVYTVMSVQPSGGMKVKGPNGHTKYWGGHSRAEFVTKADGSALKVEPHVAAPSAPAVKPHAEEVKAVKAFLQDSAPANIGDLPDGSVIGTPDGKVGVLKKTETAYDGYTAVYDIETGQKFEAPSGKKPVKFSGDDAVKMEAASALSKAQTKTGKTEVGAGGGPSAKLGPPPKFDGIASGSAAEGIFSDQKKPGLTEEQKMAMRGYTDGDYAELNPLLRNSKSVKTKGQAQKIKNLDDAIAAQPELDVPVVLSRKTDVGTWASEADVGKVVQDNGFLSTSTYGGTWSGVVTLQILVPAGGKGLFANKYGNQWSSHPGEKEVILPRGSQFHVLKKESTAGGTTLYVEMIV